MHRRVLAFDFDGTLPLPKKFTCPLVLWTHG